MHTSQPVPEAAVSVVYCFWHLYTIWLHRYNVVSYFMHVYTVGPKKLLLFLQ